MSKKLKGPFNDLGRRGWKWARAYRPAKRITDHGLFAHMHCEVSEAWRECTEGNIETTYNGSGKPHGLGAELADVVIMASIVAAKHGVDLDAAVQEKFAELDKRLINKKRKATKPWTQGGPPVTLLDAVRSVMQPCGGLDRPRSMTATEVLTEVRKQWPDGWPLVSVLDVANEMRKFYGRG